MPNPCPTDNAVTAANEVGHPVLAELLESTWRACTLPSSFVSRGDWKRVDTHEWQAETLFEQGGVTRAAPAVATIRDDQLSIRVRDHLGMHTLAYASQALSEEHIDLPGQPVHIVPDAGLMWAANCHVTDTEALALSSTETDRSHWIINRTAFAGFSDWRLPTLKEAVRVREAAFFDDRPLPFSRSDGGEPELIWIDGITSEQATYFDLRAGTTYSSSVERWVNACLCPVRAL